MEHKELEKYFGKEVRDKRRENGFTQEQLAERVGISVTYLRGIEHGNHSITWKIWLCICKTLCLSIDDFIDRV